MDSVTVLKSGSCNLCKYVLHVKEKGVFKDRRGIDVWIRKHTQIFVTHPGALQCDGFNSAPCHPNVAMLVGPPASVSIHVTLTSGSTTLRGGLC